MAAQVVENLLMNELGQEFVKAHEVAKNVKIEPGNTLPDGLKGIAQLRKVAIQRIAKGKKNEGKLMFYADAIIQEPETFNGLKTAGKRTFITENIFNTPTAAKRKTVADHITHIYKWLKMLGISVDKLNPKDINQAIASLVNPAKPIFIAFRTWQPPTATTGPYAGKQTMMMHFWEERVEYTKKPVAAAVNVNLPDVVDEPVTDDEHNEQNQSQETISEPTNEATNEHGKEVANESVATVSAEDIDKGWDIDSMAKRADDDNDLECCNRLQDMAIKAGIDANVIKKAESWTALANLIKKGTEPTNTTPEEPKPEDNGHSITLGVGDHWKWYPFNPVTKQKEALAVTIEITQLNEVDGEIHTIDAKNVEIPRFRYKNVPINELEPVS